MLSLNSATDICINVYNIASMELNQGIKRRIRPLIEFHLWIRYLLRANDVMRKNCISCLFYFENFLVNSKRKIRHDLYLVYV